MFTGGTHGGHSASNYGAIVIFQEAFTLYLHSYEGETGDYVRGVLWPIRWGINRYQIVI